MRFAKVTRYVDAMGNHHQSINEKQPLYVVLNQTYVDKALFYACRTINPCGRVASAVSLRRPNDEFVEITDDPDAWPDEVYAYVAKCALLGRLTR